MSSIVQLKRSALSGKVPDTGSLNLGELAVNTYDGKIYFKKSGSIESIESVLTTNSIVTGSIRLEGTGSFGSLKVNDTLTVNHGETIISGSALVTSDLTILGAVNARQFNISVISSSVLFESGSSRFGNTSDDTHQFTGSVNITGSGYINSNRIITDADTGSFATSGGYPTSGVDYDTDTVTVLDFNNESPQFLIDYLYEIPVGTEVGLKGFIGNTSGSTLVVPANDYIAFVIDDVEVARVTAAGFEGTSLPGGLVSGSSQLTSSYDTRYVLSGSITQTTWDNIAAKPSGIVSGSSQIVGILSSLNTYTGSNDTTNTAQSTRLTTIESVTGSYETKGGGIISGSSQLTASVLATTGSNSFIGNQNISGTIYLTGSIIPSGSFVYDLGSEANSFRDIFLSTGSIRFHNPDGTEQGRITVDAKSGDISLLKTAGLTNIEKATISQGNINPNFLSAVSASSLFVQNKIVLPIGGTVHGINLTAFSSSVSSTIINQNTATSSYETKGRGIISGSSQLNNASIENLTVINLTTVNETASVIFSSGSNRFGDFGNDTHSFTGSVQISGSFSLVGTSTATSYNGTINATNGIVSGSSQITYASISSIPAGIVSGSAQTILNLPTGVVSGSSQINVMSTTNIARLATTGSNTFVGNQTVTGNILPEANGTRDLGSAALRWSTVYTSDLSLNNGIGDWTIVEGEDDLFLYNNKKGKVYKFALTEVDPNVATPKKS